MLFDSQGAPQGVAQQELPQIYPDDGWVEHDPEEIWRATVDVCRQVIGGIDGGAVRIAAIGITNQRETTFVWDRATGEPIHNAIVWQDRRTADRCAALSDGGHSEMVAAKSGLVLDAYFSGTKIAWILDNVEGARQRAEAGKLAFGTADTFLLWRLTGGRAHATDATNASRTMLFDIHAQDWDDELLELLGVPRGILPEVLDSSGEFGTSEPDLFGAAIPITGIAGDQQAATIGQACFEPGMIKSTYGTGCFVMLNTGSEPVASKNKLLTTVAYRLDGQTTYALEGSIFVAGAAVQWLRDGLRIIDSAEETEAIAAATPSSESVYLVPAFTGLGAPYWDPDARGAILGLTRDTGREQIVRAALDAVCYQTRDLMLAMEADGAGPPTALRVDGGMVVNDWLMQHLSDTLDVPVERPQISETTALGAAYLAGLGAGMFGSLSEIVDHWQLDRAFAPSLDADSRETLYSGWLRAVDRVRGS